MASTAERSSVTSLVPPADCCATLTAAPLARPDAEVLARLLKAVADPTRLQLLSLVAAAGEEQACVCDLTAPLGLTQPTVSHHLKVLVDAGLLTREQRGVWAYYALVPAQFRRLRAALELG